MDLCCPHWLTDFSRGLRNLQEQGLFCDVVIQTAECETYSAHANVLAAASPILSTYMQDSGLFVKFDEISAQTWQRLLEFMYTGKVFGVPPSDAHLLYEAARKLGIDTLTSLIDSQPDIKPHLASTEQGPPTEFVKDEDDDDDDDDDDESEAAMEDEDNDAETSNSGNPHDANRPVLPTEMEYLYVAMKSEEKSTYTRIKKRKLSKRHHGHDDPDSKAEDHSAKRKKRTCKTKKSGKKSKQKYNELDSEDFVPEERVDVLYMYKSMKLCPATGKSITTNQILKKSVIKSKAKYKCDDCGYYFLNDEDWAYHQEKRNRCPVRPAPSEQQLEAEAFRVTAPLIPDPPQHTELLCRLCPAPEKHVAPFSSYRDLNQHLLEEHEVTEPLRSHYQAMCTLCQRIMLRSQLDRHYWTNHQVVRKRTIATFQCPHCDYRTCEAPGIMSHVNSTHKKIKKFMCDICGREFGTIKSLKMHCKVHTGVKNYRCKFCNDLFAKAGHLTQHISVHTGWKPYRCKLCDKAFTQLTSINLHLSSHHKHIAKEQWKDHREYVKDPETLRGIGEFRIDVEERRTEDARLV